MQLQTFKVTPCYAVTTTYSCTTVDLLFKAVTGPQLQFYDAVTRLPGSVHDSRIFNKSRVRVLYEAKRVPGLLLGDASYACVPYLMTPLTNPRVPGSPEARYATFASMDHYVMNIRSLHKLSLCAVIITLKQIALYASHPCAFIHFFNPCLTVRCSALAKSCSTSRSTVGL